MQSPTRYLICYMQNAYVPLPNTYLILTLPLPNTETELNQISAVTIISPTNGNIFLLILLHLRYVFYYIDLGMLLPRFTDIGKVVRVLEWLNSCISSVSVFSTTIYSIHYVS